MAQTVPGGVDIMGTGMKKVINDRTTTLTHDFVVGHKYEVVVRAVGPDGAEQAMEHAVCNTIVIQGQLATPSPSTALTATGLINAIQLTWTNPLNYDLAYMEVYRSSVNARHLATKIAEARGLSYVDSIGSPDATRYYWIRAVNTSGQYSNYYPNTTAGISATSVGVVATDIADFAITATKMFNKTIILTGDAWTNNSPGAGSIAWNAHSIVYNGASYSITAGNTALGYVYWVIGDAVYSTSATHPALGATGFMVAINTSGIHTLVWNSSANMVIGSAFIANLSVDKLVANAASTNEFISNTAQIKDGIINDLKITGTITVGHTDAKCTDALADQTSTHTANDAANYTGTTISGVGIQTSGSGGLIRMLPTAGVGFQVFNEDDDIVFWAQIGGADEGDITMGDYANNKGCKWDNSEATFTVRGVLNADDINAGGMSAERVTAGTFTGLTFQTATVGGQRIVISQADNTLRFYDGDGDNIITIDDDAVGYITLTDGTYFSKIYVGGINIVGNNALAAIVGQQYNDGADILKLYGYEPADAAELVFHVDTAGNTWIGGGASNEGEFTAGQDIKTSAGSFYVGGTKVVGTQGAAVANATDAATTMARLNDLLARCRAHGLIAT